MPPEGTVAHADACDTPPCATVFGRHFGMTLDDTARGTVGLREYA